MSENEEKKIAGYSLKKMPVIATVKESVISFVNLLKDNEWLTKSAMGYIGILLGLSLFVNFMQAKAISSGQMSGFILIVIVAFLGNFYAAVGLTASIMKKIIKGENTPMFSFEKDQINVLKYTLLVALCLIGLVLLVVLITFITGLVGLKFLGVIFSMVAIPVLMVKFMLVIPSCVDDKVVGIKESIIKTTGYELHLIGILLLLMVFVFVIAFVCLLVLAFISPILALVFGVVINILAQILGMIVAAKVYLHFKNNNLLD